MKACKWGAVALALSRGLWFETPDARAAEAPRPAPAAPARVEACSTPSLTDTEAAKNAYRSGQAAFSEGDYERAAALWTDAYEHDCTAHALLLNLATANELLGRPDRAIEALQRYDERQPDSPYVEANTKRIERLQRIPAVRPRPRPEPPPEPCPRPLPARELARPSVSVPTALVVGGGVLALAGGIVYVQARVAEGAAADRCGPATSRCSSLESVVDGERARARAQASGWLTGAGLMTLASGLVWHFLLPDVAVEAAARGLHTSADVGSNSVRMWLHGSF